MATERSTFSGPIPACSRFRSTRTAHFRQDRVRFRKSAEGPGEGYNLNIPLAAGSGVGAYLGAFERVIVPALRRFAPEFIIVPCGFDAGCFDPMARMMLGSECFRAMTRMVQSVAGEVCAGRLVMCHEGGYHKTSVPFFGLAVSRTIVGDSQRNG